MRSEKAQYRTAKNIPTVVSSSFDSIRTVLLHEPGAAWTYGVNIDWLGRIVEQQRGIAMPIVTAVDAILKGANAPKVVAELLARPLRAEIESDTKDLTA